MYNEAKALAEKLHDELTARGIEVILDDRDQRAGVKFKDSDLIGFPLRVTIGTKGLEEGKVEIKWRWDQDSSMIDIDTAVDRIPAAIEEERRTGARFAKNHVKR